MKRLQTWCMAIACLFTSLSHGQTSCVGAFSSARSQVTEPYDQTFWHIQIDTLDTNTGFLNAWVQSHLTWQTTLTTVSFDFKSNMLVTGAWINADSVGFTHVQDLLTLHFNAINPGAHQVRIQFQGTPMSEGLGSYSVGPHPDGQIVWTLSQPYGAMNWWPVKQDLADKADSVLISATLPQGLLLAAPGLCSTDTLASGFIQHQCLHRYPIPAYLVAFAVAPYLKLEETLVVCGQSLPFVQYVMPSDSARIYQETRDMHLHFEALCDRLGPYPYADEQYGHAQMLRPGGMEHPTMSFMGSWHFEIRAHELAHHWFGNKITCGAWAEIWLNEGFATYLSGLVYEATSPNWYWPGWLSDQMERATQNPEGTLWVEDTSSVSRVFSAELSYFRSAMFIHTLRSLVGDNAFFSGLQHILEDPTLAWRFFRTEHVQQHLETTSGMDLSSYFQRFLKEPGVPDFYANLSYQAPDSATLVLQYHQTSAQQVSLPALPIEVSIQGENQDTTLQIWANAPLLQVHFPLSFVPVSATIDPHHRILCKRNPVQIQWTAPSDIWIFPQPAHSDLHLASIVEEPWDITLWNLQGQKLWGKNFEASFSLDLPLEGIPSGPYVLEIRRNQQMLRKTILIAQP